MLEVCDLKFPYLRHLLHRKFLIVLWAIQPHNTKLAPLLFVIFLLVRGDCIN